MSPLDMARFLWAIQQINSFYAFVFSFSWIVFEMKKNSIRSMEHVFTEKWERERESVLKFLCTPLWVTV
jgi:hypothetical protein